MDLFARGGWVMFPLGICSLVALTVIVERLLALLQLRGRTREFVGRVDPFVREGNVEKAESVCRSAGVPLARVLEAGLRRAGEPPEAIGAAMHEAAAVEMPPLHARLGLLTTLAQVGTMLGFLGTVTGMIRAFQAVDQRSQAGQLVGVGDLSSGIWEALITTAAGLVIAIPIVLAAFGLGHFVNVQIAEMERYAREAAEALSRRRRVDPGRRVVPSAPAAREGVS